MGGTDADDSKVLEACRNFLGRVTEIDSGVAVDVPDGDRPAVDCASLGLLAGIRVARETLDFLEGQVRRTTAHIHGDGCSEEEARALGKLFTIIFANIMDFVKPYIGAAEEAVKFFDEKNAETN